MKGGGFVKNKSSFRSLFSIFRSSKPAKEGAIATSYSTSFLPSGARRSFPASERSSDTDLSSDDAALSAISLPDQIKLPFSYTPSSSSSSASSFDFASDASTTATTPSNSSPSVLMKASDMSSGELQTEKSLPKKRFLEGRRKLPSPLSTVTDAHNSPYMLPSPPASEVLRERHSSFQPNRRNSLGRLLSRAYRSNPDLTKFDDGDSNSAHIMPSSAPSSRPGSSGDSSMRSRKLGKKKNGGEKGRADSEKRTNPEQERMERRSILGADPAGVGFYLYPKTAQPELPSQKVNVVGGGRSGLSGPDNGRRAWREQKGRSFQRTIATPMIVEEEGNGNDTYAVSPFPNPQRRHSRLSMQDGQLRQARFHADQPAPPQSATSSRSQFALPSIDSLLDGNGAKAGPSTPKHTRRRSLHNSWDHINAQKKIHQQISALEVPPRNSENAVLSLCCEESTLRYWRQEGMHEGKDRSDVVDDEEFDTSQSRQITDKLSGVVQIPIIRVEMVNV